jgi:hypothetical protein
MATEDRPLLRVVRGEPDDAELAALTMAIAGIAAAAREDAGHEDVRSRWSDPRAVLRRPISHGRGAWRASGLPG